MIEVLEPVLVEALVPKLPVEAFYIAVLLRFSGLDEGVLHFVSITPFVQGDSREFGTVVGVDSGGLASELNDVVEDVGYALTGYGASRLQPKALLRAVVDYGQKLHGPALGSPVVYVPSRRRHDHESPVHAPSLVGGLGNEGLEHSLNLLASMLAAANLESALAIDPVGPLQVDIEAFTADEDVQSPIAPAFALGGLLLEKFRQWSVVAKGAVAVAAARDFR